MLAKVISGVFSPYLTAIILSIFLVFKFGIVQETVFSSLILVCFMNIFPFMYVIIMKGLGKIKDLHISSRKERYSFYLFLFVSSLIGGLILLKNGYQPAIQLWLSFFITTVLVAIINFYWKVSAHSAAATILMCWLCIFFGAQILFLGLFILLLVIWSRIYLGHHNLSQTIIGILVGLFGILIGTI